MTIANSNLVRITTAIIFFCAFALSTATNRICDAADNEPDVDIQVLVRTADGRPFEGVFVGYSDKLERAKGVMTNASGIATFPAAKPLEGGKKYFVVGNALFGQSTASVKVGGVDTDLREWNVRGGRAYELQITEGAQTASLEVELSPARRAFGTLSIVVEPDAVLPDAMDSIRSGVLTFVREPLGNTGMFLGVGSNDEVSANYLLLNQPDELFVVAAERVFKKSIPATAQSVNVGSIEVRIYKNVTPVDIELTSIPTRQEFKAQGDWARGVTLIRSDDKRMWTYNSVDGPISQADRHFRITHHNDKMPAVPDGTYVVLPGFFEANKLQLHVLDLLTSGGDTSTLQLPTVAVQQGMMPSVSIDLRALLTRINAGANPPPPGP